MCAVVCFGVEQAVLDHKFTKLKGWIHDNGGYVHDALRLCKFEKPPYLSVTLSVISCILRSLLKDIKDSV